VSLCLTDFLADGFQLEKKGFSNILIHAFTFIPALIIALYFPNIFIKALSHAGIYATILLILLPACMVWNGRYRRTIAAGFKVPGGKFILIILIIFSLFLIIKGIIG
jgi:tyrosine-specific transport protein